MDLLTLKFLRILKAELEDLQGHLDVLADDCRSAREKRTATEYVTRENLVVFQNEGCCIKHFIEILDEFSDRDVEALQTLADQIQQRFAREIDRCGYAPAALRFAERKITKVLAYVAH